MSSRAALAVLVLAIAGGGAWWLVRGSGPRGEDRSGGANDARSRRGKSVVTGTVQRSGAPIAAKVELRYAMDTDASQFFQGVRGGFFGRLLLPPISLDRPAATAEAGADGRFHFEGLGRGAYEVTAIAADGARGAAAVTIRVDGARAEVDPEVAAGRETLACRIEHGDGRPWTGLASVDAVHGNPRDFFSMASAAPPVKVDGEGRFHVSGLEPGGYVVSAIDPGHLRAVSMPVAVPFDGEFVLTLGAPPIVVEGLVLAEPDGKPVGGAELLAGGPTGALNMLVRRTVADANGRFRIELAVGPQSGVFVSAPGFTPTSAQFAPPIPADTEIRLSRVGRVVGRVTADGDATPVAGLRVVATSSRLGGSLPPSFGETDADGRYTIDEVASGEVMVRAEGAGWVTKERTGEGQSAYRPRAAMLTPGGNATADLVVVRAGRIAGSVLDADGKPVAGAVVRAEATDAAAGRRGPHAALEHLAASGVDGRFEVEALPPGGTFDVIALAPGIPAARVEKVVAKGVAAAGEAKPVVVRLPPARFVTVTVIDRETGAPIVGASVSAVRQGQDSRARFGAGRMTGADGVARLGPLDAEPIRVAASNPDYVRAEFEAVDEGESSHTLRLARGHEAKGRVVDPEGSPAAGAWVTIERNGHSAGREQTGEDGRFRFRGLEKGPFAVSVTFSSDEMFGMSAAGTVEAGGAEVELRLAPPVGQAKAFVVRVLDGDGKPVPRAWARLVGAGAPAVVGVRDGRAFFELDATVDRVAGSFVEVYGAATLKGTPLPWGQVRVGPLRAGQASLEVRLPSERAVTGVVRGPDGKPLGGVLVVGVAPGRDGDVSGSEWNGLPVGRSDDQGRFRVGGLGDGAVRLIVQAPPDTMAPAPVEVRGGDSGIELRLGVSLSIAVTVLDATGGPVADATVTTRVRLPDGGFGDEGPSGTTDAKGVARLRGFDRSKQYSLDVQPRGAEFTAARRDRWAPHDDVIRVERK